MLSGLRSSQGQLLLDLSCGPYVSQSGALSVPVGLTLAIWWQMTTDRPVLMLVLEDLEDLAICKLIRTAFSAALSGRHMSL